MLSIWDILGFIVLVGPLFLVLIGLLYVGIETKIINWTRRPQEKKQDLEIGNHLLKTESSNTEMQHYLEEIKRKREMGGPESDRTVLFIKWLVRIVILPFALLSYEGIRTFNILRNSGLPFLPHTLAIVVLSSSIVVVSIYYGFIVKYEKKSREST